jgi:hypothetical protein
LLNRLNHDTIGENMGVYRYKNKKAEETAPPKQKQDVGDEVVKPISKEVTDEYVSTSSSAGVSRPSGRTTTFDRGGE